MSSAPAMLHHASHAPFLLRQSPIASSSRHVFHPRSFVRPAINWSLQTKRRNHTATQYAGEEPALPGIPTQIYVEPATSLKGKEKEVTPSPEVQKRKSMIKAKKNAITMTPSAIQHLQRLLSSPDNPQLLRIGVKSRGCAGMAYHLDYVSPPGGKFDEVVEQDGVRVLIDSKALFSIIGSRMDWRDNRLSAGFVFDNPNVVDTCGCGESFNIRV